MKDSNRLGVTVPFGQGTVRHVFGSMTNIGQHVSDALEIVRQLQTEQPA